MMKLLGWGHNTFYYAKQTVAVGNGEDEHGVKILHDFII
jgi:hypothetical protein